MKRNVHVRSYKRLKNGKWESVTEHERIIDTVELDNNIIEDIRKGKSRVLVEYSELPDFEKIKLDTYDKYKELIEKSETLESLWWLAKDHYDEENEYEDMYEAIDESAEDFANIVLKEKDPREYLRTIDDKTIIHDFIEKWSLSVPYDEKKSEFIDEILKEIKK